MSHVNLISHLHGTSSSLLSICLSLECLNNNIPTGTARGVPWWLSGADAEVKKMLDEYQKVTPKPTMLRSTATRSQMEMLPQYYAGSTIPRVPLTGRVVPPIRKRIGIRCSRTAEQFHSGIKSDNTWRTIFDRWSFT